MHEDGDWAGSFLIGVYFSISAVSGKLVVEAFDDLLVCLGQAIDVGASEFLPYLLNTIDDG